MSDDKSSEESLPKNWVTKKSTKYPGRIYYFNTKTGKSKWELPREAQVKAKESKYLSKNSIKAESTSDKSNSLKTEKSLKPQFKPFKIVAKTKSFQLLKETDFTASKQTAKANKCNKRDLKKKKRNLLKPCVTSCGSQKCIVQETNYNSCKSVSKSSKTNEKSVSLKHKVKECLKNCDVTSTDKDNQTSKISIDPKNSFEVSNSSLGYQFSNVQEVEDNFVEDVEMVDLSEEAINTSNNRIAQTESYFLVVDTNVFLSDLKWLDEIKHSDINNCGPPNIYIPWIVIQELDNLKHKHSSDSKVHKKATEAIKYINSMFKMKNPRFHGQSPQEISEWAQNLSANNDNHVLNCCTNLTKKIPKEKVILITNDINLLNKGFCLKICSYDLKAFLKSIELNEVPSTEEVINPMEKSQKSEKVMIKARKLLKDTLYNLLKIEMFEAYGHPWKAFKLELDHLDGIFKAIEKYWRCVFSFKFTPEEKNNFDLLKSIESRPSGFICSDEECVEVLLTIEKIFLSIKKKCSEIEVPIESLSNLKRQLHEKSIEIPAPQEEKNIISISNNQNVFNVFNDTWIAINNLCGSIMDFYGIQHTFVYVKTDEIYSKSEIENFMNKLYPAVCELKMLMSKLINKDTNTLLGKIFYTKFHTALKNFIPSLSLDGDFCDRSNFTVEDLQNFCELPTNNELLLIGYQQLETNYNKLEEAVSSMPGS